MDDYTITKYKEGFCLLDKATGRLESGFYGFSDGVNFYLNLFQFSDLKYYLKAEIIGEEYFVDEVFEQNLDFNNFNATYGAMFGAGGTLAMMMIFGVDNDNSEPKKNTTGNRKMVR